MSLSRTLCLAIGAILIPGGAVTAATVTYDGGTPNRPVSVVGIDINSILYDVTFTYNNNAATNPLRVGSLPDTDIPLARTGLAALLSAQSIGSHYTALFFQPNDDTLTTGSSESFEFHGYLENSEGPWTEYLNTQSQPASYGNWGNSAFAQFAPSIVPEPSAISGCLGLVGMGLIVWRRRKSNRKKK